MASEKLNLGKTVLAFLKTRTGEKFTTRQIAEWVFETFPAECQAKKARSQTLTTDTALLNQLAAEIGSQRPRLQKKHPELKVTEGNPHRYYYSEQSDADEVMQAEDANVATNAAEPGLKGELVTPSRSAAQNCGIAGPVLPWAGHALRGHACLRIGGPIRRR